MKSAALVSVVLILALPALSSDQQKTQKELNKVTAMATDFTGRRAVNISISQLTSVPRAKLVEDRGITGLNYGCLFIAEQLVKSGMTMQQIGDQLKDKTIFDVANEQHLDWKEMAASAKKLNSTIDDNLYKGFLSEKSNAAQDASDKYDVHYDGVKTDADVSKEEIASAQDRFLRWRDQAAKAQGAGRDKTLGLGDERVAYADHDHGPSMTGSAGRGSGGTGGNTGSAAPVGMGGPQ
jgi:hypothetical protein